MGREEGSLHINAKGIQLLEGNLFLDADHSTTKEQKKKC